MTKSLYVLWYANLIDVARELDAIGDAVKIIATNPSNSSTGGVEVMIETNGQIFAWIKANCPDRLILFPRQQEKGFTL